MKISVVIPNFNDSRIKRTLDSVYAQTYKDFEIIVVDGLSTNEAVIDIYRNYKLDKLFQERDKGIFDALNKGIRVADGEVIYLMGSDDYLPDPETFKHVVDTFGSDSGLDGVCLGCEFSNSKGRIIRKWYPGKISGRKMKLGILPPHFSLFLKKELYEETGDFKDEEFNNVACDTIWLMDLALKRPSLKIDVITNKCLIMEYGGASTGTFSAVLRQFKVIHNYAREKRLPFWFLVSFIKSSSKLLQFKLFGS